MKRILLFVLVIGTAVAAYPGPLTDLDETQAILYDEGAELRFLQLEYAIERNIAAGKIIIDNLDGNTSLLEGIIKEMEELLEEVQDVDLDQDPESLSETYLILKTDARELTTEFRTLAVDLAGEERLFLKEQIRVMEQERLRILDEHIERQMRHYNAERVRFMLNTLGHSDDAYIVDIQNGRVGLDDIRENITGRYSRSSPEIRTTWIRDMDIQRQMSQDHVHIVYNDAEHIQEVLQERSGQRHQIMQDDQDKHEQNQGTHDVSGGSTNGQNGGSDGSVRGEGESENGGTGDSGGNGGSDGGSTSGSGSNSGGSGGNGGSDGGSTSGGGSNSGGSGGNGGK